MRLARQRLRRRAPMEPEPVGTAEGEHAIPRAPLPGAQDDGARREAGPGRAAQAQPRAAGGLNGNDGILTRLPGKIRI